MNPEKVGQFIKRIRKENNLTQAELANKYNITYQAVSKWENGKNLPDISLLRQMSKDFNISIEDILDGEIKREQPNKKKHYSLIIIVLLIIIIIILKLSNNSSFKFKTISTTCDEFKVSGSIAYDKNKSSIYISNIDYCGGEDNTKYAKIECNLYEVNNNNNIKISSCQTTNETTLEDYLKNTKLNINDYEQSCKLYNDNSLYLEINATDKNNKTTNYKIPLKIEDNC